MPGAQKRHGSPGSQTSTNLPGALVRLNWNGKQGGTGNDTSYNRQRGLHTAVGRKAMERQSGPCLGPVRGDVQEPCAWHHHFVELHREQTLLGGE